MRIQSQRETFAYRIIRAFDWRDADYQDDDPRQREEDAKRGYTMHRAPLENGHELQAWSWSDDPGRGWTWAVHTPTAGEPEHRDVNWPAGGGLRASRPHWDKSDHPLEEHEAKGAAEAAYQKLFPVGGPGTGSHDSGIDYSDLNSFKL